MSFYILSKDDSYRQAYETTLTSLTQQVASLKNSPNVQQDKKAKSLVEALSADFQKFSSYRGQMIELATDESKNLVALAYANENINPLSREIAQILSQLVASEEEAEISTTRKQLLIELNKLRYSWSTLMNEMRLYLAFRAPAAKGNIALYQESLNASVKKIKELESYLDFEQQDGFEQFKALSGQFDKNLDELIKLHAGETWRTDAYLLRTEIGPALISASSNVEKLVSFYQERSKEAEQAVHATTSFGQRFLVIAVLCVGFAVIMLGLALSRAISGPLVTAMNAAKRIASDDLTGEIEVKTTDEPGQLLASLADMQTQLRERIETERIEAIRNARVKQALDRVESCVMVAKTDNSIVYINEAMRKDLTGSESDIRKDVPEFSVEALCGMQIDQFFSMLNRRDMNISSASASQDGDIEINGHYFRYKTSPVFNDTNERAGTVVEWQDRTHLVLVEKEIEDIVNAVQNGDLEKRIDVSNKDGFLKILGGGVNTFIDLVSNMFNDIAYVMEAMSQGDLSKQMQGEYNGMFDTVKEDINKTVHDIRQIIEDVTRSTDVMKTSSDEISNGNGNLSQRTDQQAANLEETAASIEQLTATVEHNADNSQQASQLAINARDVAEKGGSTVSAAVASMAEISTSSHQIAEIISVIDEIAFQTNLLALNASVEAARAGEQGRGFAVVASEVRNLAQRSAASAKEIKDLIQDSASKVKAGTELVNESGEQLNEIVTSVKKVGDIIAEIAAASREQTLGIQQVNQAVQEMDEITQQNSALAEETSAASASMSQQATEMRNLLGFFQCADDGSSQTENIQSNANRRTASRPWLGAPKKGNSFDFASARSKHLAWKTRLRNFLDGKEALTQAQAVSHKDCDLGKWLYSEGLDKYGHYPEMQKMEVKHKNMHAMISKIISEREAGNTDAAESIYKDVGAHSDQIVNYLNIIEEKFKSGGSQSGTAKAASTGTNGSVSNSDDWDEF